MNLLQQVQQLQFTDKVEAERLLLSFINTMFPMDVIRCELRPQVTSLNSFNGFIYLADGGRKFFKTHTEQDNIIDEYYNAGVLAEAGYPVIQPIHSSTQAGQHLLIYEVIESPSVFEIAWELEQTDNPALLAGLTRAQHEADDELLRIYQQTLAPQSAPEAEEAPIHQLFYHRLIGGRLDRFYGQGGSIALPDKTYTMHQVRQMKWIINGQVYHQTLDDLIAQATDVLQPHQAGLSVIGHGDAHNGNVFYDRERLLYFDPAFAGRHHPLLDIVKPIFHNAFAMWMYYPSEKRETTAIRFSPDRDVWRVEYDYRWHPVREMFLMSKFERTLKPFIHDLAGRDQLPTQWRVMLKSALFCCPFLTLNLADGERFSPEISLLGLAMALEMGLESDGERSRIDRLLDEVEQVL